MVEQGRLILSPVRRCRTLVVVEADHTLVVPLELAALELAVREQILLPLQVQELQTVEAVVVAQAAQILLAPLRMVGRVALEL